MSPVSPLSYLKVLLLSISFLYPTSPNLIGEVQAVLRKFLNFPAKRGTSPPRGRGRGEKRRREGEERKGKRGKAGKRGGQIDWPPRFTRRRIIFLQPGVWSGASRHKSSRPTENQAVEAPASSKQNGGRDAAKKMKNLVAQCA